MESIPHVHWRMGDDARARGNFTIQNGDFSARTFPNLTLARR